MSRYYDSLTADVVLSCAGPELGARKDLQADFEHGQWWVTNRYTGAQWSVVEVTGPEALAYEQVTQGDDS